MIALINESIKAAFQRWMILVRLEQASASFAVAQSWFHQGFDSINSGCQFLAVFMFNVHNCLRGQLIAVAAISNPVAACMALPSSRSDTICLQERPRIRNMFAGDALVCYMATSLAQQCAEHALCQPIW
jgi:hypothetical protein